jgi:hypothetical protein
MRVATLVYLPATTVHVEVMTAIGHLSVPASAL